MMVLPNLSEISVAQIHDKVQRYCLNEEHKVGKHKAYLFRSLLGITIENADILTHAIVKAIFDPSNEAVFMGETDFCKRYNLRFQIETNSVSATILTAWCLPHNANVPHLVTAYIQ
jgi:hypothetical protein